MKLYTGIVAAILTLFSSTCLAQNLEAIVAAEEQVLQAWAAAPLAFRQQMFVSEEPAAFGSYSARGDNSFKAGEPLLIYSEPVGYAWKDNGDGSYTIGFAMDLALKKADGNIIAGKEDFLRKEVVTWAKAREFMLYTKVDISGAPAGDYVVGIRVRDLGSDKYGVISLPFSIVE